MRRFYFRRALRLLPALVTVILASLVLAYLFGNSDDQAATWKGAWSSLFFVSNWSLMASPPVGLGPLLATWSLAIEDQFYIVWALSLPLMLGRVRRSTILIALLVLAGLSVLLCFRPYLQTEFYAQSFYGTEARASGLLIGCITGLLYSWGMLPTSRAFYACARVALAAGSLFLAWITFVAPTPEGPASVGGFVPVSLTAAALILLVAVSPNPPPLLSRIFTWKPLVWFGTVSYGLYLWHYVIYWLLSPTHFSVDVFLLNIIAVVLSVATAALCYRYIEKPFLRLKHKDAGRSEQKRAGPALAQGTEAA